MISNLQEEKTKLENRIDVENPFLAAFRKYENINKLTRDILIEHVDTGKVYENGNIGVKLIFANEYRGVVTYIEVNTSENAV